MFCHEVKPQTCSISYIKHLGHGHEPFFFFSLFSFPEATDLGQADSSGAQQPLTAYRWPELKKNEASAMPLTHAGTNLFACYMYFR